MAEGAMDNALKVVRIVAIVAILIVALIVALSPSTFYAPVPRTILFWLSAIMPALLLGAEAANTTVRLKLPTLVITSTGAFAVCLAGLYFLTKMAKPEQQIAVYDVVDKQGQPVLLDVPGILDVKTTNTGLSVTHFEKGNTIVLIFPEQVAECVLNIKEASVDSRATPVTVGYAGNYRRTITLP
jgi:hypothetical protein